MRLEEFESLIIQLLNFMIVHEHWIKYGFHNVTVFKHVKALQLNLGWLIEHLPTTHTFEPPPG